MQKPTSSKRELTKKTIEIAPRYKPRENSKLTDEKLHKSNEKKQYHKKLENGNNGIVALRPRREINHLTPTIRFVADGKVEPSSLKRSKCMDTERRKSPQKLDMKNSRETNRVFVRIISRHAPRDPPSPIICN